MKACSLCGAPLEDTAPACARCGIASPFPPRARHGRGFAVLAAVGVLFLGGAIAWPAVQARSGGACEPRGWVEWHVAMKKACLAPAYVCENMTAAKLLEDPEVASNFRRAVHDGEPGAYARLDALVGHMRDAYGCDDVAPSPSGSPSTPALPPGHPPIDRHGQGARLPPGHPPIEDAPPAPVFEAPAAITI